MLTTIKEAKCNSAVGNKHRTRESASEREIKASDSASQCGMLCGVLEDVAAAAHEGAVEPASAWGLKPG